LLVAASTHAQAPAAYPSATFMREETAKWGKVIKTSGI
jgi:hypothetical protein